MRNNYLSAHLEVLFNQAITSYKKIRKGEEVEAIHQLRVNLKKINAIFRLLSFVLPETFKSKPAFKPLKKLFDLMGTIRDLQIAQQVIDHYDLEEKACSSNLKKFIQEQLTIAQDKLLRWKKNHSGVGYFNQAFKSAENLKAVGKARWLKDSAQYISNLQTEAIALMQSRKRDKWHKIRISIKRIRFVLDWALTMDKDFVSSDQYKKIRILGEILGDWHDRVIVLEIVGLQTKNLRGKQQQIAAADFARRLSNDQKALLATARFYLRDVWRTQYFSPN